jgi:NADH-quinone oxidoreductase subunit M
MVIAAVGTVLAAGYLLWMFQRVAMGERSRVRRRAHPRRARVEWIAWTPLLCSSWARLYPHSLQTITTRGGHLALIGG